MWNAYEVKSSTSVKRLHNRRFASVSCDENCGIEINDISIVVIDNSYQKHGHLEVDKLFKIESVYDDVIKLQSSVQENIQELKKVLSVREIPKELIGEKCFSPYNCDFGHSGKMFGVFYFNLANLKKKKLRGYHSG